MQSVQLGPLSTFTHAPLGHQDWEVLAVPPLGRSREGECVEAYAHEIGRCELGSVDR